jgi:hypothetical protein
MAFINFDFVRPACRRWRAIHRWFAGHFKIKANLVRAQLIGY